MTNFELLSSSEMQVLGLASQGTSDEAIAATLNVPTDEIGTYWQSLQAKLGKQSRADLIQEWRVFCSRKPGHSAVHNDHEAFAYSVSHDLREPLRIVHGFTNLIQEELRPLMSPEHEEMFERIVNGCRRMSSLIDAHLNLSLAAVGELEMQPVDLSRLADEMAKEICDANPTSVTQIVVEEGLTAMGDPCLLRILVENLIGNAVKFSAKRTKPTVRFGSLTINGERAFFVADNGIGFDQSSANKLFEPFFRLHADCPISGTGVGLTICERVAKRYGGRVWAESREGCGATFFFVLPSAQPRETSLSRTG